jgi:Domain of unknown function (DUF4190)/GYF domain 2
MSIYLQHNGQQVGPFSLAEVKSQLASGALSPIDPVWWKGEAGWVPLAESAVLRPDFQEPDNTEKKAPDLPSGLSPFALGSLLCGLLSFIGGPLASIPGIILGHLGLREIKLNPKRTGKGLAFTGLVLSYIMTVVTTVILVSFFMFSDQIEEVSARDEARAQTPPPLPALPAAQPAASSATTNAAPATATPATNAPESSAPVMTSAPDQSTNAAPTMTNAVVVPATNAPDSNPNTGPMKE